MGIKSNALSYLPPLVVSQGKLLVYFFITKFRNYYLSLSGDNMGGM